MEKDLLIELLEEGDKVSLYSPRFDGEEYTEFERFLLEYKDKYPNDVAQIVYRIDIAKRDGAEDRYRIKTKRKNKRGCSQGYNFIRRIVIYNRRRR